MVANGGRREKGKTPPGRSGNRGLPRELAGLPVSSLGLSSRASAALARAGYATFGDVLGAGQRRIRSVPEMAPSDLARIQELVGALASLSPKQIAALARPGADSPWRLLPAAIVVAVASAKTLSAEVRGLVAGLRARDADAFLRRLGAGHGPVPTLEALGAEFGVTRERVRQVCAQHAALLTSSGLRLPIACAVAAVVKRAGGMAGPATIVATCRERGLSVNEADLCVLPSLARLRLMPEIAWHGDIMQWVVPGSEADAAVYAVRFKARVSVARRELGRVGAVAKFWGGADDGIRSDDVVTALTPEGRRLRERSGWLVALPARENVLVRTARKVLSVAEALSAAELAVAVARRCGVSPPPPVVRLLLSSHPDFDVSGKLVRLAEGARHAQPLSEAEAAGMRLARAAGNVIASTEFSARMLAEGYSLARARQILVGPLMVRQSPGLYRIRGSGNKD